MVRFKGSTQDQQNPIYNDIYTLVAEEIITKDRSNYYLREFPGSQFRKEDFEDVFDKQ